MGFIQRDGFDFVFDPACCEACAGHCCCGESGNVWVSQQEVACLCEYLQMNRIDFIEKYLVRVGTRFSCKERVTEQGLECIFFKAVERRCSVYALRPAGCRTYPFWDYFKTHTQQLVKECPGVRACYPENCE